MENFALLNEKEMDSINGGGVASMVAGAMAGAMIGAFVSLPYAAYTGNANTVGKAAIAGASAGAYIGAGCPLP